MTLRQARPIGVSAMKKIMLYALLLALALGAISKLGAQVTVTIGEGSSTNLSTQSPTPYGTYDKNFRQQYLYHANEIQDAGGGSGNINSLAFEVEGLYTCPPMTSFKLRLKHTDQTELNPDFEAGDYQEVFLRNHYIPAPGWNVHTFSTPFVWNGNQNILVEVVTDLSTENYAHNASVYYTATTYNSALRFGDDLIPALQASSGVVSPNRANIRFNMAEFPLTAPPYAAQLISPPDGATLLRPTTSFSWISGGGATVGYKLNFGTNNPPSNIEYMLDLADASSYTPPSGLAFDTTYYWQIVPYNSVGNSANCPVWSFSTHGDTTIYELPYTQNWDAVTVPELPFGWTALASTTSAWATVETTDSFSYSPPNCVRIFKGTNTFDQLLLVSPKISPLIPMNSIRIKARIKNAYSLQVGVITNPADLSSFEPVKTIFRSGSEFAECEIPLRTYTGAGRHIAFRHSGDNPNRRYYIDDLILEEIAEHDLAATAIRGNFTPSVNATTYCSVDILNYGAAAQNSYTVKLVDSEGLELGSAAGPTIPAGETITVSIPWTPTQEGEMSIYAKVILASDMNTLNDETPPQSVSVRPEGTYSVTIGDGDQTQLVPWNFNAYYSLFQCLYLQDEIGTSGKITALSFYNNFHDAVMDTPIKIWLRSTIVQDLSSGLLDPHSLTLVYDGTVDFPAGENTITIPLQVPYSYAGYNLVLYTNRPLDTNRYTNLNRFKAQTVGTNRARYSISSDFNYDPMAPSGHGMLGGIFPKITLIMEPLADEATYVVTPAAHNFGDVSVSETAQQDITISNAGGAALGINNISISGNPAFTLTGLPALPASINTGGSLAFGVNYSPGSAGVHSAQILITDNLSRELHRINVQGIGYDATIYSLPFTQNWDTATVPDLPLGWSAMRLSNEASYTSINTSTESPYSAPNCMKMWYSHNVTEQLYLISPLIDDAIDISKIRIRAMMKDWGALRTQIGTMVDPTNPHSFELAGTFTIVGDWTYGNWSEYIVSLTHHTGVGRYIAFRPDPTVSGFSMCMDDLVFEEIVPNDLAAISLRGSTTCPLGLATDYTVRIFNNGYSTQSNYQVQLVNAQGNVLAVTARENIAAGETADVILSYIPNTTGFGEIMGKVVLAGDSNSVNNKTPPLGILVPPVNMFSVTIGDGDEYLHAPWDFSNKNSLFQALYYRSDIGSFGKIVGISFYNSFEAEIPDTPIQLWLGNSYLSDLSAGWIDPTTLTKVYDGMMHFPAGENTITIPLSRPYNYVTGNLVLYAHRPMDKRYYRPEYNFQGQTGSANCARRISRDYDAFNPMQPPIYETELSGSLPKTTFLITSNDLGSLSGLVTASGSPLPDVELNIDYAAGLQTVSSASGEYCFPFLLQGDYTLFAHKAGYEDQSIAFTIVERQNTPLDLQMIASIPVSVSGTILGSDNPATGLAEATVTIHGIINYTASTNAAGQFVVENIPSGNSYDYTISKAGYQRETGTITVGSTNLDMGTIILLEDAYLPRNVVAEMNNMYTAVLLQWEAPDALSSAHLALRARNMPAAAQPNSCAGRALVGYEIYRIASGQEDNEASWTLLNENPINTLAYEDHDWFDTIGGICRWGVKAIYTGGVSSPAALSNLLVGPSTGKIVGFVYDEEGQGISGATVTTGYYSSNTSSTGAYALELLMGVYSVTAWANGYYGVTVDNVEVFPLHETSLNFTLSIEWVANQNEVNLVTATALKGNNPNPFNPSTTIHYDILEPCNVRLDIYNIKGQKVRSLLNEAKSSGSHSIVFDARDESGRALSSGVYFYRFTAGKYTATRKMLLME